MALDRLVHWPDIGYAAEATASRTEDGEAYWVDFRVLRYIKDGDVHLYECRTGRNHSAHVDAPSADAVTWLSGSVKWDGCSNWRFDAIAEVGMLHFCGPGEGHAIGQLFDRLYRVAAEMMPACEFEAPEI